MSARGMIADIQRCSLHDGPGIRTTVFFKGCPLHCAWCHNPECIDPAPEELFYAEKCIHCGHCAEGCFSGARVTCGRELTVPQLLAELDGDRPYYGADGGVTFSGGEPMMQPAFLAEAADACRAAGIRTAIETSMLRFDAEILRRMDWIMADLKIWDSDTHRQYTGVPNEVIKENLRRADALGIPMVIRTPVIPEIDQGIPQIAEFAAGLRSVRQYELLPYHPLGDAKRAAMGQPPAPFTVPPKDIMKEWNTYAFLR